MGRPRVERLQRGPPVLGGLPADGAGGGRLGRPLAGRLALGSAARGDRVIPRPVALRVRVTRTGPFVARRARGRAPAGALARADAARGRAGRVRVLHGGGVGVGLLPPAHRSTVDQRPPLLAPGAHELGPDERQRAGADAEAADRAERGCAGGGGADRFVGGAGGGRAGGCRRARRTGRTQVREAPAALPRANDAHGGAAGSARGAGLRDRRRRLQSGPALAGGCSGDGPARSGGHRVPRGGAGLSGADGRVLLVDAHGRDSRRARHALQLRASARRALRVGLRRARSGGTARPAGRYRAPARPVWRRGGSFRHVRATDLRNRSLADRRGASCGRGRGPGSAGAPAARRGSARPRARGAEPRVPRPARRDGQARGGVPRVPRRARQARRSDGDPDGRPRPGARDRRPRPPGLGRAPGAVRGVGSRRAAGRGVAGGAVGGGGGGDGVETARGGGAGGRSRATSRAGGGFGG